MKKFVATNNAILNFNYQNIVWKAQAWPGIYSNVGKSWSDFGVRKAYWLLVILQRVFRLLFSMKFSRFVDTWFKSKANITSQSATPSVVNSIDIKFVAVSTNLPAQCGLDIHGKCVLIAGTICRKCFETKVFKNDKNKTIFVSYLSAFYNCVCFYVYAEEVVPAHASSTHNLIYELYQIRFIQPLKTLIVNFTKPCRTILPQIHPLVVFTCFCHHFRRK